MKKVTNGRAYTITTRPWWLSYAYLSPYSKGPVVARVHATRDDGQECMLDITESDLVRLEDPGILVFPTVVDGRRPKTNRADKPLNPA